MQLNPEDSNNFGPHCRNCHRGSSDCEVCHSENAGPGTTGGMDAYDAGTAVPGKTTLIASSEWRNDTAVGEDCANEGFSWPHRTLGFRMLKDEMFGLDFDGTPVGVNEVRDAAPAGAPANLTGAAHDLDSACTDCHNPNIWNPNLSNELLLKGLQ